jgi:hypothetical protein
VVAVELPERLVAVNVYVVVTEGRTVTLVVPDTVPTSGEMLRLEAPDTAQLSVVLWPRSIVAGIAVKFVRVGGGFAAPLADTCVSRLWRPGALASWRFTASLEVSPRVVSRPPSPQPDKAIRGSASTQALERGIIISLQMKEMTAIRDYGINPCFPANTVSRFSHPFGSMARCGKLVRRDGRDRRDE